MADNIGSGSFAIISEGGPIGINNFRPGFQFVRVDGPIQQWTFRKGDNSNEYWLSIGEYPFTGVIDDKVIVSINPEDSVAWKITYREFPPSYTIALASDPSLGWTTDLQSGEVNIRPIIATKSIPPQFLPSQLFTFEPIN